MLIKSLILRLSLLQGYLGILATHFLSTAYFKGRENTEFSRAVTYISTHPVTLLELHGAHTGAGGSTDRMCKCTECVNAQDLFCFPRSCHGSPARCRVPKGSEYQGSFPATPLAASGPASTSFNHFSLLPLHILSQAGREFPCHTPGSALSTGYSFLSKLKRPCPYERLQFSHPIFTSLGKTEGLFTLKLPEVSPCNAGLSNTKPTSLTALTQVCLNRACRTNCPAASRDLVVLFPSELVSIDWVSS